MKEKKTRLIQIQGSTLDHLDRLREEYMDTKGFKITINNLLLKLLQKATLKDIE